MPSIEVNGVRLTYEERGSGDGILLVHGTGGNVWGELPDLLASEGRVVDYHRRSFGDSTHPPFKGLPQHAADAAGLIDALELAPVTVVSYSMGGVASIDLTIRRPELVRELILIEPPLHFAKHPTRGMLRQLVGAQLLGRMRRPEEGAMRFMRWATTMTDGTNGFDTLPAEARAELVANSASILRELQGGTGEHIKAAELGTISCPTVLLLGGSTLPEYGRAAARLHKALPALEIVTVPGAGHVMPVSHPQAVVDALRDVRNPARAS